MAKRKNLDSNLIKKMYEEGYSTTQISKLLKITISTVQYHLYKTETKMRTIKESLQLSTNKKNRLLKEYNELTNMAKVIKNDPSIFYVLYLLIKEDK